MSYKALILEDEPIARDLLTNYISQTPALTLEATAQNAFEATEILKNHTIDVLFLDIHLPELSGLNFLKTLLHPPKVIITTAYQEYALEGFELAVSDYLLKPFSLERFLKAVNQVVHVLDLERQESSGTDAGNSPETSGADFILVKDRDKYWKVPLSQILYLEAYGNYVRVHTDDERYVTSEKMQYYEAMLTEKGFLRIHRSYIVAFDRIEALEGNQVIIGGAKLPVSQSYKATLEKKLNQGL